ncbi:MAG: hypothetical protein PF501_14270 [Salinisphaera sp.]|jgi:NADH dehydrogenase|nr:hypothetical protein [Salinisphaera sp.]
MSLGAAGTVGRILGCFASDIQVRGRLALAAYRGLERQHELVVLGKVAAGRRLLFSLFTSARGPRLKVH